MRSPSRDPGEWLVSVPDSAKTTEAPVVFVWHGHGGTMKHAAATMPIHKHWPEAIVVYTQGVPTPGQLTDPEGKKSGWQPKAGDRGDRDLKFFDEIQKTHAVRFEKQYAVRVADSPRRPHLSERCTEVDREVLQRESEEVSHFQSVGSFRERRRIGSRGRDFRAGGIRFAFGHGSEPSRGIGWAIFADTAAVAKSGNAARSPRAARPAAR